MVTIPAAVVADAGVAARAAADRYGLRVTELSELDQFDRAVALMRSVWRVGPGEEPVNVALMRAFTHSGGYVVGAFVGHQMIGTAVAFLGDRHLHSHITGVERGAQGKGVGFAIKQHQRAWALRRGINRVAWTFDPLVRRNAYFNFVKLGVTVTEYLADFYGRLSDGINSGEASDRLYVNWQLDSPAATAAAAGEPATINPPHPRVLLGTTADDGAGTEEPVMRSEPLVGAGPVLVAVPEDVEMLRRRKPATAARWRYAVREALISAFDSGYRIVGMTGSGRYVLSAERRSS